MVIGPIDDLSFIGLQVTEHLARQMFRELNTFKIIAAALSV
jgi:hypothetical protein